MTPAQLMVFASLDFPGRPTLRLVEIAGKLGCTKQHLLNQIEEGTLVALDLKGAHASRQALKVPVECYRDYLLRKLTGPKGERAGLLDTLLAATAIIHGLTLVTRNVRDVDDLPVKLVNPWLT